MRCEWCEREIKQAVAADGRQYCGRLCAAQDLLDIECEENGIDDCHSALTSLFLNPYRHDGAKCYGVKVRESDALEYDHDDEREGFYPIIAVIEDDKTPDWVPEAVASVQ